MSKAVKILLWIFMVLVLVVAIISGTLYYFYYTTDETNVTPPPITFAGHEVQSTGFDWYTPVFGGALYKSYGVRKDAAIGLGTIDTATLSLSLPQDYAARYTLSRAGTDIASGTTIPAPDFVADKNGTYHLSVTLTRPKVQGKAYGSFTYEADFTLDVAPKIEFSTTRVEQGDVVSVVVSGIMDDSVPAIETKLSNATFTQNGDKRVALLGVSHNRESGDYPVTVTCGTLTRTETVTVVYKKFGRQDITVDSETTDETMNNPAGAPEWQRVIWPLFKTADTTSYWKGRFIPPHGGKINTPYGIFRYVNGSNVPERHVGIDIDGNTGDTVSAPNNGKVVYVGTLIFTGNTVVIEHGGGLKSYLFHMDSLAVQQGDMVTKGQKIGTVGSTGYSTGPHLHYEVKIGNQSVNPSQLFDGTSGLYFAA